MIHLVVALPAEARGLGRGLGLGRRPDGPASRHLYRGRDLDLLVSGPGRARARQAVESLAGQQGSTTQSGWLNVGIAGHADLSPGTCLLAEEIRENATGRSWRPTIQFRIDCPTVAVCTVDRPETEFATNAAYDMEASGFFAAASQLAAPGMVQVLKVVSDNRGDDLTGLTADRIETLLHQACGPVVEIVEQLRIQARSMGSRQPHSEPR